MANTRSSYFIFGMILLSLALGIFNSYFFVFVNALFISEIGTSKLPLAYLTSGFGGLLITWVFNSSEKKWGFAKASTVFGLFFALVMFLIWYAYVQGLYLYFVIFFAYAWLWVSSNFTTLVFWKLPSYIFNLEENKKYNGVISSGEGISSIISYLSVPALLTLDFFTRDKFLMISFFGILSFSVITYFLSRGIGKNSPSKQKSEKKNEGGNQKQLVKEPYFKLIFLSVLLAVVIQFLIDFSLMVVSAEQMSDPLVLAQYFSLLFGGMRILELVIKSFVSKYLVKEYGVFISLSSLIFALGFITIIGISSYFIGYLGLILIVASLSKVFERSLYRSVYAPTINLLYQAYPLAKRGLTQNYADGFGKTFGQLIAAIFIFGISGIENFEYKVLFLLLLVLTVLIVWLIVSKKLIHFYRLELSNILQTLNGPTSSREGETVAIKKEEKISQDKVELVLNPVEQVLQTIAHFLDLDQKLSSEREKSTFYLSESYLAKDSNYFLAETEKIISLVNFCSAPQLQKILDQLVPLKQNHPNSIQLLELIELFLHTTLLQKNTNFNFYNSQKKLKVADFLYTSVIQHLVKKQVQGISDQEYYYLLEERIQKYTYLLICRKDLGKTYPVLDKLLASELKATKNDILFCLSFKHDPVMLNQIVTMINQSDKSQELISLELLELILEEQEKKWVLPMFKENNSDQVLVKLQSDFPQVVLGNEKRLLSILSAYTLDIPRIIKAKALEALILHFPSSSNQQLALTLTRRNPNSAKFGIRSTQEESKGDDQVNVQSRRALIDVKLDHYSISEQTTSLQYFYWVDAIDVVADDPNGDVKMKPVFETLFSAVFPMERLN